jgi:hypothetical protein
VQALFMLSKDKAIRLTESRIFRTDETERALSDAPVVPDCIVDSEQADILHIAGQLATKGLSACPIAYP